jgi:hypothetical protein
VTPDAAAGGPVAQDSASPGLAVSGPWEPTLDATSQCVTSSPPWYRIDDLRGNWRYRLLLWLSVGALIAGVVGLFVARRSVAGFAATLALTDAVLFALIWVTHTI